MVLRDILPTKLYLCHDVASGIVVGTLATSKTPPTPIKKGLTYTNVSDEDFAEVSKHITYPGGSLKWQYLDGKLTQLPEGAIHG